MTPFGTTLIILSWILAVIAAARIGSRRKGRPNLGLILGLLLGWIGVLIIAVTPPTHDMLVLRERERLQVQREARDGA
jgi:predicted membrane channel-forming protein YqfA (hemolysin III family)